MTFREIDQRLLDLVDPETGEILDVEAFKALAMDREAKAENMALWVIELNNDVDSLSAEIERLKAKKRSAEKKIASLKGYLRIVTNGEKLKTPIVSVSYRRNEQTNITDEQAVIDWAMKTNRDAEVLKYAKPEIRKTEIKKLIDEGIEVPGAVIEDTYSTIIK